MCSQKEPLSSRHFAAISRSHRPYLGWIWPFLWPDPVYLCPCPPATYAVFIFFKGNPFSAMDTCLWLFGSLVLWFLYTFPCGPICSFFNIPFRSFVQYGERIWLNFQPIWPLTVTPLLNMFMLMKIKNLCKSDSCILSSICLLKYGKGDYSFYYSHNFK